MKFFDMKTFLELFQQQDGSTCALNAAVVFGFVIFWVVWLVVSVQTKAISDVPMNVWFLLTTMLGAKVGKDYIDYTKAISSP